MRSKLIKHIKQFPVSDEPIGGIYCIERIERISRRGVVYTVVYDCCGARRQYQHASLQRTIAENPDRVMCSKCQKKAALKEAEERDEYNRTIQDFLNKWLSKAWING